MLILDLWGISFHAAVVFGLGKEFLFKSALGHCEQGHLQEKLLQRLDFKNIVKCREVVKKFIDFLKLITTKKNACKERVFKIQPLNEPVNL